MMSPAFKPALGNETDNGLDMPPLPATVMLARESSLAVTLLGLDHPVPDAPVGDSVTDAIRRYRLTGRERSVEITDSQRVGFAIPDASVGVQPVPPDQVASR